MPIYRKRWSMLKNGNFGTGAVTVQDPDAPLFERRFYVVSGSGIPKARILCMGDSITAMSTSYRPQLHGKLSTAGYRFTFVGSQSTDSYGGHEGYGGKNCTEIAGYFVNTSPYYPADIVIIHSAHNLNPNGDVLTPEAEAAIVTKADTATRKMIQTARTTNPAVKILLAKVIPSGKMPNYSYIPAVNVRLGELAAELNTEAQPVISVDQATGFDWPTDTTEDMVHPNYTGAAKMAQKFFDALVPLLE
jgi:lysophospholipase L1-like esterase